MDVFCSLLLTDAFKQHDIFFLLSFLFKQILSWGKQCKWANVTKMLQGTLFQTRCNECWMWQQEEAIYSKLWFTIWSHDAGLTVILLFFIPSFTPRHLDRWLPVFITFPSHWRRPRLSVALCLPWLRWQLIGSAAEQNSQVPALRAPTHRRESS